MRKYLFVLCILAACSNNGEENGLLDQGQYKPLTDSIKQFPTRAELYYNRGKLLYQDDHKQLAKSDIEKAWQLSPKEEYALSLVTIYQEIHVDSAIAFIQTARKQLPGSVALQVGLARGYQQKKEYAEALAVLDEVLAKNNAQVDSRMIRYEIFKEQGKEQEALRELEQAVKLVPFDAELYHTLGFEYAMLKDPRVLAFSDTLASIHERVKNPKAEPYYFKALYYHQLQQTDKALQELAKAIQTDYYFIDAHMEKGEILYEKKQYDGAYRSFQLASTITPTYGQAYFWMGKVEEAQGKKEAAKLNYQRAYSLDKGLIEAKEAADRL